MDLLGVRLIVGLGNPTARYELTRHNAGFWFVDQLAVRYNLRFVSDSKSQAMIARWDYKGSSLFLLKPMQFMNLSGSAIAAVVRFHKLEISQVLVAHDELDFLPGVVKLKLGGGHGGHNGLRDAVAKLGSGEFARIRIGIGRPAAREDVVGYVLGRPSVLEREEIDAAIDRAVEHFPVVLEDGLGKAMNVLHGEIKK